jgi:hypothetical protein
MAGFTDLVELKILNQFLQDPNTDFPGYATLYIGLSSTTPTDAGGNVTEPATGSYARVSTTGADWGAATGTAPCTKSNTAVKTFPTATADWLAAANLTYFVLYDALTVGNLVAFGQLTTTKPVLNGDTASFAAGALILKLGDPGDSY